MSMMDDVLCAAEDVAGSATGAIDQLVHGAAVQLLNGLLPPLVHGGNIAAKTATWALVTGHATAVQVNLAGLGMGNTVLAGMVAKKVEVGLAHLAKDTDYARAVNSIR